MEYSPGRPSIDSRFSPKVGHSTEKSDEAASTPLTAGADEVEERPRTRLKRKTPVAETCYKQQQQQQQQQQQYQEQQQQQQQQARPEAKGETRSMPAWKKLSYVLGPIGSLIDQAAAVGLELRLNSKQELEFARRDKSAIPLTGWGKKAWTAEVKRHINDNLLMDLHDAVKPMLNDQGQPVPPRRKDMAEFPSQVDRFATMVVLHNHLKKLPKAIREEVDLDIQGDFKNKATLHSIMAGSIRPNGRVARSHGLTPNCRCGAEKEDVGHVFGHCQDHQVIRQKYQKLIEQEVNRDAETKAQLRPILLNQTFANCGIVPDCHKLIEWHDSKDDDEVDVAEVTELEQL